MSAGSWPPGPRPPYGPPPGPYGQPWPPLPVRPPAPATLILVRIASITLSVVGLGIGVLGSAVIMTPTTMMLTGCSGDSACLRQFLWVFLLPPAGCLLGAVVALIGTIAQWRSHWVITWGVLAIGLSVAGIIGGLRVAGYWPPP